MTIVIIYSLVIYLPTEGCITVSLCAWAIVLIREVAVAQVHVWLTCGLIDVIQSLVAQGTHAVAMSLGYRTTVTLASQVAGPHLSTKSL